MIIDNKKWEKFKIEDIFIQKRGKECSPNQTPNGNIPLINESSINNGLYKYGNSEHILKGNAITISVNNATTVFYQEHDFIASVNILVLYNENLNYKNALFICSVLRKAHLKYDYTHKISRDRLNEEFIFLPSTNNNTPDWKYMENYITQLEKEYIIDIKNYITSFE